MRYNYVRQLISGNKFLFYIILFSLVTKLLLFFYLQPWEKNIVHDKILVSDAISYNTLAVDFVTKHSFYGSTDNKAIDSNSISFITHQFDSLLPPGYPLFLSLIYFLFGIKPYVIILFQILLSILSLIFLYRLTNTVFNEKRIGYIACILFSIEPHQIYYTFNILSDTLYVTLLLFTLLLFFRGIKNNKTSLILLAALFSGILPLIRPISEFLPIVFITIILLSRLGPVIRKLKIIFLFVILYALAISPWMMRNKIEYDHFSLNTGGQYTLLMYDAVYTEAAEKSLPDTIVMAEFHKQALLNGYGKTKNPFDKSAIYSQLGKEYIKKNIVACGKKHFVGIINMLCGLGNKNIAYFLGFNTSRNKPVSYYSFTNNLKSFFNMDSYGEAIIGFYICLIIGICYLFFFYGSVMMIRNDLLNPWLIIMSVIAYHCILTGVIGVNRYKLPITPFYIIVASYGIYFAFRKKFSPENSFSIDNKIGEKRNKETDY